MSRHPGRAGASQPRETEREKEEEEEEREEKNNTTHNDTHTLHYSSSTSVPTYLGRAPYPPTTYLPVVVLYCTV